jgi:hypothetical protein
VKVRSYTSEDVEHGNQLVLHSSKDVELGNQFVCSIALKMLDLVISLCAPLVYGTQTDYCVQHLQMYNFVPGSKSSEL